MIDINKEKILIIRHPNIVLEKEYISSRGYSVEEPYLRDSSILSRSLRKLATRFNLSLTNRFYNQNVLSYDVDTIIIFESLVSKHYISWIRFNFPRSRIIVWYWNIAQNTIDPESLQNAGVELWSFSRKDCKMFNMNFNPGPYFSELSYTKKNPIYDISFVGKDKGRLESLIKLKDQFEKLGLTTNFIITPTNRFSRSIHYSRPVPYKDTIQLNSHSSVVLDLIEINDSGQSLRIFESLFSKQKVITNSLLIKDYEFYNPSNIYVLEPDNFTGLIDFMKVDYIEINDDIVRKYDFDNWVVRFFERDVLLEKMLTDYIRKS